MAPASTFLSLSFIAITLLTVLMLYFATGRNRTVLLAALLLMLVQALFGLSGFYLRPSTPPRFPLLVAPSLALVALVFFTPSGKKLLLGINLRSLTYLHTIRIAVEMVLWGLAGARLVPVGMTFEGQNFDILAGLSAPLMAWLVFDRQLLSVRSLRWWNIAALVLLLNVVVRGVLSAPSPFQQLAFEQPNVAVLYFPFVWLPSIVVGTVLFAHLAALARAGKT